MDTEQVIEELKAERQRLDRAIDVLEGGSARSARTGRHGARRMSAEARRRISEAQKKRWASRKQGLSATMKLAGRKRSGMSAAGRKRLSEMMKKRWAARKRLKAA